MNLFDLISSAQGGNALNNLGRQFGLDTTQTELAVKSLLPAFSKSLKRNTSEPEGLTSLLEALQGGDHQRYVDDPALLGVAETVQDGNGILGHLFGTKEVSRQVANHVSAKTGIGATILKKMLPVIAALIMGSLARKSTSPDLSRQIEDALGKSARSSGSWLGRTLGSTLMKILTSGVILKWIGNYILKRIVFKPRAAGAQTGTDIFGSLLDADGDGSWADDLFAMAARGLLR